MLTETSFHTEATRERRAWIESLTAAERVQAMRAGQMNTIDALWWASWAPEEVPEVNGEWEFIYRLTPEGAGDFDPPEPDEQQPAPAAGTCDTSRRPLNTRTGTRRGPTPVEHHLILSLF